MTAVRQLTAVAKLKAVIGLMIFILASVLGIAGKAAPAAKLELAVQPDTQSTRLEFAVTNQCVKGFDSKGIILEKLERLDGDEWTELSFDDMINGEIMIKEVSVFHYILPYETMNFKVGTKGLFDSETAPEGTYRVLIGFRYKDDTAEKGYSYYDIPCEFTVLPAETV